MVARQQLVEHAHHGGEADPGREQHNRRLAIRFQVEIAGGGHHFNLVARLQPVVQQVGDLALRLAFDADAIVAAVRCIRERILTDFVMLELWVNQLDAEVLARHEGQHRLAIFRCQQEGGDKLALGSLLLDDEGAGPLPATALVRLLLIDLPLAADEDVGQHAICLAPCLQHLVSDRTSAQFFERGQEMTTYNVILFWLDQESGMLVGNPLDRAGQRSQIVDIFGVGSDGVEQRQWLTTAALMGQIEDIFQLRVMAEHPLVEVLRQRWAS